MEKKYIKIIPGDITSLYNAMKEAERLGYKMGGIISTQDILLLREEGIYVGNTNNKYLKDNGYTEHIFEQFVEGEMVECYDNEDNKQKRIYLFTDKNGRHICVSGGYEEDYKNGEFYITATWSNISKLPKEETITITASSGEVLTISKDVAKGLGFNF